MPLCRQILYLIPLLLEDAQGYTHETCCRKAKADKAFVGLNIPSFENQTCGQEYSPDLNPAIPLFVPYSYCANNCGGIGLHKADLPGSWAGPLVQFILPSIIFSMTIPRQHKIEYDYLFDWPTERSGIVWVDHWLQLLISMLLFTLILIPVFLDTMLWMCTIIVGAGNMLVGGLYEAHLDYQIIEYVQLLGNSTTEDILHRKRELLVTITSGNLKLEEGNPQKSITRAIILADPNDEVGVGEEKSRSRLLNLLGAQSSFGSAVGSPVLFYLGAFAYSILDLFNDPSSESAAISLGFGIEWMIIVHVAMVSGCLLASNNPSTSSGIVGSSHEGLKSQSRMTLQQSPTMPLRVPSGLNRPRQKRKSTLTWKFFTTKILGWSNSYDTLFQPVSLWDRGTNKMRWVENCDAFADPRFKEIIEITFWGWIFKVYIPCLLLIALPPATGGAVAYYTPPKGIACRSLSFIVYASCQAILVTIATIHAALDDNRCSNQVILRKIFTGPGFVVISSLFWFGSLVSAVGGTLMQIIGVYNNCICYAGANSWWNIWRVHPTIQLATDTANARHASVYWIWMGSTAAVFMALNCYVGWWYQRLIRHRFQRAVKGMFVPLFSNHSPAPSSNDEFQALLPRVEVEGLGVPMSFGRDSFESGSDIGEGVELDVLRGGVRRAGRTRGSFGQWEGVASSSSLGVGVGKAGDGEGSSRMGSRPVWLRPGSSDGGGS